MEVSFKDWRSLECDGIHLTPQNKGEQTLIRLIAEAMAIGGRIKVKTSGGEMIDLKYAGEFQVKDGAQ